MNETLGARLRQHRERQGISIAFVSHQTKLKASLLEALERDDISQWPVGIFRRAWVRNYAQAIGLDPKVVTREFLEMHPEPVAETPPVPEAPPGFLDLVGSALGLSRRRRVPPPAAPVDPPPHPVAGTFGRSIEFPQPVPAPAPATPLPPQPPLAEPAVDLLAAAELCTELGRVEHGDQILPVLRKAARVLGARGLIVWLWDATAGELRPALVHGYSGKVMALLPALTRESDNPTAEAFRSARPCTVSGGDRVSAALVLPLLTPAACAGVLAIELPNGVEDAAPVRATATFLAAMLALLLGNAATPEPLPEPV